VGLPAGKSRVWRQPAYSGWGAGRRVAVHDDAGDRCGGRDDRECDVGELAVGRWLPRLAELDERDDQGERPETGTPRGAAQRTIGGGGAT
jgi:hypothetical protein